MHCPLVAKTNARWSIVDCRLVACAKAADFDERAKSNQSGHRNLNRAPEGEHFIKKSKRDRQAKTGEDSPLGEHGFNGFTTYLLITTYFLFWSNPILLNWRPVVQ